MLSAHGTEIRETQIWYQLLCSGRSFDVFYQNLLSSFLGYRKRVIGFDPYLIVPLLSIKSWLVFFKPRTVSDYREHTRELIIHSDSGDLSDTILLTSVKEKSLNIDAKRWQILIFTAFVGSITRLASSYRCLFESVAPLVSETELTKVVLHWLLYGQAELTGRRKDRAWF